MNSDIFQLPSYGIRRIQAAVAGDAENSGHKVTLIDLGAADVVAYARQIVDFDPELRLCRCRIAILRQQGTGQCGAQIRRGALRSDAARTRRGGEPRGRSDRRPDRGMRRRVFGETSSELDGCRVRCGSVTALCCLRRLWCARRRSITLITTRCSLKMRPVLAGRARRWREKALS